MDEFLTKDQQKWLNIMKQNYENNRGDFADLGTIGSWIDCYNQLINILKSIEVSATTHFCDLVIKNELLLYTNFTHCYQKLE
jgi:hypothetical protein